MSSDAKSFCLVKLAFLLTSCLFYRARSSSRSPTNGMAARAKQPSQLKWLAASQPLTSFYWQIIKHRFSFSLSCAHSGWWRIHSVPNISQHFHTFSKARTRGSQGFTADYHPDCPENLYVAHKKLPHKTLRVHSARYTQCMHVSSRKLKTTKEHSYQTVQTAPTHLPLPKSGTIH